MQVTRFRDGRLEWKEDNRRGKKLGGMTMDAINEALDAAPMGDRGDRRSQLQAEYDRTIVQINDELAVGKGKRSDRGGNKPSRTQLLLLKGDMLKRELEREDAREEVSRTESTNADVLSSQNDIVSAQARVATLESQLASMRLVKQETVTVTLDADVSLRRELDATKEERDGFKMLCESLLKDANLPVAAVKSLNLKCPPVAKFVCNLAGVNYDNWKSYAHSKPDAWGWNQVLNGAAVRNHGSELCVFCLASLEAAGTPYVRYEFASGDLD